MLDVYVFSCLCFLVALVVENAIMAALYDVAGLPSQSRMKALDSSFALGFSVLWLIFNTVFALMVRRYVTNVSSVLGPVVKSKADDFENNTNAVHRAQRLPLFECPSFFALPAGSYSQLSTGNDALAC